MKSFLSLFLCLFTIILFAPADAFACACCADPGFYKISVQKPGSFEVNELKRLNFQNAHVFSNAGFPENIKGLETVSEQYEVSASVNGDAWNFALKDKNGKEGTLELRMPTSFVDYAVDTRSGEKGGAGSVVLYKEWRFKYKVNKGTGIFQNGVKSKAEYFLVLQGKGNVCNSAEDFKHWRLEITGKNANYAFFGDLSTNIAAEAKAIPQTKFIDTSKTEEEDDNNSAPELNANLIGTNYSGCGCSGITPKESKKKGEKRLFYWSEFKQDPDDETVFINLDGKDTELKLLVKGERPKVEKIGDRFSDEYAVKGTKVILDYVVKKLPCEECEGTDYDVTATIIGEYSGKVVTLSGSCGC